MWLGANDMDQEGQFVWKSSQTPMNYTNWSSGNPDDAGNEGCVHMWLGVGEWNDVNCDLSRDSPQATMSEVLFSCDA